MFGLYPAGSGSARVTRKNIHGMRVLKWLGISWAYDGAPTRSTDVTMAVMCGLLVFVPFFLSCQPGASRVALGSLELPGLCLSQSMFHTDCPGCGMTRAFVFFSHGMVAASVHCHRLGPLLYVFFVQQFLMRCWSLSHWATTAGKQLVYRIHHCMGWGVIFALLINWLLGVFWNLGN